MGSQCRPSLKELLTHVVPSVASKWYLLGLMLLDDEQVAQLDNIKSTNFSGGCTMCCVDLLKYWLQTHPNATWIHLVEALESPGVELPGVAMEIKKLFASG